MLGAIEFFGDEPSKSGQDGNAGRKTSASGGTWWLTKINFGRHVAILRLAGRN